MNRKLKVGITLRIMSETQSIWENGIFQNCVFLAMLFERAQNVDAAYLIITGTASEQGKKKFLEDIPCKTITEEEAVEQLDVIIEMSMRLSNESIKKFLQRKGKLVVCKVGNDYFIDTERVIFDLSSAATVTPDIYNAVWTIPEYTKTCKSYFNYLYRSKVVILPHLWSSFFIEKYKDFKYKPNSGTFNVAIFEPNICNVKTSFIPLLCCEEAFRNNRRSISGVAALNTKHLLERKVFKDFCDTLEIEKNGLVVYENRLATFSIMAKLCNAVVSHQIENAQNYLYYELLYGNYPLIHNSKLLDHCGYYYNEFDCIQGGKAIQRALDNHDKHLTQYQDTANLLIERLSPFNKTNIEIYSQALEDLYT